jgi:hypothetical protein
MTKRLPVLLILSALVVCAVAGAYFINGRYSANLSRSGRVLAWIRDPAAHPSETMPATLRGCPVFVTHRGICRVLMG